MSLAKFSVQNAVLVNMIMVIVFIMGIITMYQIPKEEMPAVEFGSMLIIVTYPGVSPAEMEQLVVKKIEDEISDVDDIDYMTSNAQEGRAVIMVNFEPKADVDRAWSDLNTELDKVRDLPEDAEDPLVIRINMREVNPICNISLGGEFSGNAIREIAEDLRDGLLTQDYIAKVDIYGTQDREIWVNAKPDFLNQYGITLDEINQVIASRNMNVPGGTVDFGKMEFLVRTVGQFDRPDQIAKLFLKMDKNGRAIKVEDVATVVDTLKEIDIVSKLNGEKGVNLYVYQKDDGNIISIMKNVRQYVADYSQNIPGLLTQIRMDGSIDVKNSVRVLGSNAVFGMVLVFLTLWLFLGWRNALFAAWGIPFSFLATFIMMKYMDVTINNISLFGLVLVLGMIVDDAIVVLENVHRYSEMGYDIKEATIKGTQEVMWPVIAAVSTTCAAFLPMLLMEGMMGKFLSIFPVVVTLALIASLVESLVILPAHIADLSSKKIEKVEKQPVHEFLVKHYVKILRFILKQRLLTTVVIVSLFILSVMSVFVFRLVKFEFFPKGKPKTIVLSVQTPTGTSLETTNQTVSKIENFVMNMPEKSDVEAIVTQVGAMQEDHRMSISTSNSELRIDLKQADERNYDHELIKKRIRDYVETLPGIYSYKFSVEANGPPTGADIELRVKGENLEKLDAIGEIIKDELKKIPGVTDVQDSFTPGKKELQIIPKPEKMALAGVTLANIASVVRIASYGTKVSDFRGFGTKEYDIVLRVEPKEIDEVEEINNLKVRTKYGNLVAIKDLCELKVTDGLSSITHRDRERTIVVTGANGVYTENGKVKKRTTSEVMEKLFGNKMRGTKGVISNFTGRFPGYTIETGGTAEEQQKSYKSLGYAFIVALLLVFSILAAQFKSYAQPLIVMLTIPLSFIGVTVGLLLSNTAFSLNTFIAIVALAGVVVNDSLVLVDFVNRTRESGLDRWNSLIEAGATRLRPIILTTVTTIAGIAPMAFSTSETTSTWKSMAVSICFGLGFATLLTLFYIPVVYSYVDSFFGFIGLSRFKQHMSFKEAMRIRDNN